MARILVALVLAVAFSSTYVASEDSSSDVLPVKISRMPCAFGSVMLRGGPILLSSDMPVITRITFVSRPRSNEPREAGPETPFPLPRRLSDSEGIARSIDSLFSLAHPASLFRENFEEFDRWHEARMRALEEVHSTLFKSFAEDVLGRREDGGASSEEGEDASNADSSAADVASSANGVASSSAAMSASAEESSPEDNVVSVKGESVEPTEGRQAMELPSYDSEEHLPVLNAFDWTPTNLCGLALLGFSFGLLLSMLLLSLSTLIYGCGEETVESGIEPETHVETPLLKAAGYQEEEPDAAVVNPICKYEPPEGKA